MVNTPPDIQPNARFTGRQVQQLLGICKETLRQHVIHRRIRQHYGRSSTRPYYIGREVIALWHAAW